MVYSSCLIETRLCDVPWLFNVYMDGVVREVNVRVLRKELELLSVNGGRFRDKSVVIC